MRIAINLASRPFADIGPAIKRLRIAMGVLAVLALVLGIGRQHLHHKAEVARARDHSLDGSIARINQERQGYQTMMQEPKNAQVLDESAALNRLFDEKAFSWTLAMEDLETVLPGGVQATSLEPLRDKKSALITLRMRVVGPRDKAVELVQNLEHSKRFVLPRIIGETSESNLVPGAALEPVSASNRVNFEVLADYNPATAAERRATRKKAEATEQDTQDETGLALSGPPRGPGLRRPPYTGGAAPTPRKSRLKPSAGAPR